jgi:hypothetical protein
MYDYFNLISIFSDGCLSMGDLTTVTLNSSPSTVMSFPKPNCLALGTAPRNRFPAVICSVPDDTDLENGDNSGEIGAVFHVLHVRDDAVQLESQVGMPKARLHDGISHFFPETTLRLFS